MGNVYRLAAVIARRATRYDSGFGTVDYTCDECGQREKSRALPEGWSDEGGGRHRCPGHQGWPCEFACETCPAKVGFDDDTMESRVIETGWTPENDVTGGVLCPACAVKWLDADGSLKPGAPVRRTAAGPDPDRGIEGQPPPPQAYAIGPARYAKNMMAIRCAPDDTGFKTRAARLAEILARGRYSHREKAYILSRAAAARFEKLYAEGWDGEYIGKALIPPPGASPRLAAIARRIVGWVRPDSDRKAPPGPAVRRREEMSRRMEFPLIEDFVWTGEELNPWRCGNCATARQRVEAEGMGEAEFPPPSYCGKCGISF